MKKIILIASFVALFLPVSILGQSKNFNRTVDFSSGGDLRVSTDVGSLKMSSWDRHQVEIIARIEARNNENTDADYARRAVEATRIEVNGDGRSLTIKANYDDVPYENKWGGRNRTIPKIDWEIRAPRRANINLNVDRSEAELRGFEGHHRLQFDRTPVRVEDLAGEISLNIDRGGDSKLTALNGSLQLESDRTDLTFDGLQITGDSKVQIDRGKLDLRVPSTQGLFLSMNKERRTQFETDFSITTNNFNDNKIEGAVNGGGPKLSIQSDRAKIHLRH